MALRKHQKYSAPKLVLSALALFFSVALLLSPTARAHAQSSSSCLLLLRRVSNPGLLPDTSANA